MLTRILTVSPKHSFFLLGPRQVGKTHWVHHHLKPDLFINLLLHKEYLRYARDPSLLSKEIDHLKSHKKKILVVIDEIQKCPELLNEVHLLMESGYPLRFVLTGSSARKLRKGGVNLLGGRALTYHMFPLTDEEWGKSFDLDLALSYGSMPSIVMQETVSDKALLLESYVETYLKEEIQQEALTRNLPAFSRFLELAAFENGHLLNLNNLSREVGVHSKTIKEYFQILEDTLIGFFLYPYTRSHRQKLVAHPKFYFFDPGVVSALRRELSVEKIPGTSIYGNAFEHWCLLEIQKRISYHHREARLSFFRTADGTEVDLILEIKKQVWAIEIKSSNNIHSSALKGLQSFARDHDYDRLICLSTTPRAYQAGGVEILPWQDFMGEL